MLVVAVVAFGYLERLDIPVGPDTASLYLVHRTRQDRFIYPSDNVYIISLVQETRVCIWHNGYRIRSRAGRGCGCAGRGCGRAGCSRGRVVACGDDGAIYSYQMWIPGLVVITTARIDCVRPAS